MLKKALEQTRNFAKEIGNNGMGSGIYGRIDELERRAEVFSVLGDTPSGVDLQAANSVSARPVSTGMLAKEDLVIFQGHVWQVSTANNSRAVAMVRTDYQKKAGRLQPYTERVKITEKDRAEGGMRLTRISGVGAMHLLGKSNDKTYTFRKNQK